MLRTLPQDDADALNVITCWAVAIVHMQLMGFKQAATATTDRGARAAKGHLDSGATHNGPT